MAVGSASSNAMNVATHVALVTSSTTTAKRSNDLHQPVSASGSSASDRSQQQQQQRNGSIPSTTNSQAPPPMKQRKPSLKMTLKKAYSNASAASPNVFTDERRQLVFSSWQEITEKLGKFKTALKIFQVLFDESPALRSMFGVPSENFNLETSVSVTRHIHVFANVLDLAVRNVLDLEAEVGPVLLMFGRRHFYKHQVDFRNEYLILFGQSISEVIYANLSETYAGNPEVTIGWRLLISYLIKKVKEGYDSETLQQTRK